MQQFKITKIYHQGAVIYAFYQRIYGMVGKITFKIFSKQGNAPKQAKQRQVAADCTLRQYPFGSLFFQHLPFQKSVDSESLNVRGVPCKRAALNTSNADAQ